MGDAATLVEVRAGATASATTVVGVDDAARERSREAGKQEERFELLHAARQSKHDAAGCEEHRTRQVRTWAGSRAADLGQ